MRVRMGVGVGVRYGIEYEEGVTPNIPNSSLRRRRL